MNARISAKAFRVATKGKKSKSGWTKGPEELMQCAVKQHLDASAPELLWWFVPNGGVSKGINGRNKAMGARAGVPDLHFVLDGGRAAFIEMKAPKGDLTDAQKAFRELCLRRDLPYAICRSVDEVETVLKGWGVKFRGTVHRRAA